MKKIILLLCITLSVSFASNAQVINTTRYSDMLSELKMSNAVKTYDIALKGNRADGEPLVKVLKVLMKNGVRYEHWFDGEKYILFSTKIMDPTATPQKGIQKMLNEGTIEKTTNEGMYKMKCCLIFVDIDEDDYGNSWMRFYGIPN